MIVAWLPRALADRDAQLDYIAADNVNAAIEQGDRIQHQVNLLADHPVMGRVGRKRGTRELVISRTPFVIVYRVRRSTQRVEILRVLHGAQQWPPKPLKL
ncbi:type II toxin-antitoxin system RelE/ParE family toxin [Phyllobacterium sp. LjRoot231]|uniref:type II toxin-antitoxin system RelE/ParE family toxin n=1 Tax=Phyllobacterium sp. LjRoot231 TaxID=3342289 RepID=UPI003ECC6CDD